MNELHLFAGAGGGILAGILLGHNPIGAVEINEFRRSVLKQRQRDGILPKFPIFSDIRDFKGEWITERVDIIAAGFPCDDISPAGKKAGIDGSESSLFIEVLRIVSDIRPRIIFLENSGNLVSRGLARVISQLSGLGYDSRWCRLGATHIGADHNRIRTWIVSYSNGGERKMEWNLSRGRRLIQQMERNMVGRAVNQPWIVGRDYGLPNRMDRLSSIGSAQVPGVAATAFRILSEGLI